MLLALALFVASQLDLSEARARYDEIEYAQALALLQAAQPATDEDRARVAAFIGVVHARMGDETAARASFMNAVAFDACVRFPDAPASQHIRDLFESTVRPPPPAKVTSTAPAWPVPAGVAFAAAGGVTLVASGVMGAIALSTNAEAASSLLQVDALSLDAASRDQAEVANALAVVGALLVVGGAATAGLGLVLE